MRLVFVENYLPFEIENGIFWGDDAKNLLKSLREVLTDLLTDVFQKIVAIDVVVLLPKVTKAIIVTRNRIPLRMDSGTALVALYDLEKWLGKLCQDLGFG